ncbi:MAG: hypothetical protein ACKVJU_07570 [Verrucomicrobiales bacterium]
MIEKNQRDQRKLVALFFDQADMKDKRMKEAQIKPYSFPCSVADLEQGPVISWATFTLSLSFTDFLGEKRKVEFHDVTHY